MLFAETNINQIRVHSHNDCRELLLHSNGMKQVLLVQRVKKQMELLNICEHKHNNVFEPGPNSISKASSWKEGCPSAYKDYLYHILERCRTLTIIDKVEIKDSSLRYTSHYYNHKTAIITTMYGRTSSSNTANATANKGQ